MDDYMLGIARTRGEKMIHEARQARLAAKTRQATRQAAARAGRGPVVRLPQWLAMAAARMRPTATGR
jgi:hypothetical protein